jgi:uncharacterized protein (DUF58 family)
MSAASAPPVAPFPLVPRFQIEGLAGGVLQGLRRGRGSEPVATRPYRSGDSMRTIDWAASARLSAAHGDDRFIVREYRAEEAPRVVVVQDLRPEMGLFPRDLPWLHKPAAVELVLAAVGASARQARARLAVAGTTAAGPDLQWLSNGLPPSPRTHDATPDALVATFTALRGRRQDLPSGTFVFVVSDFLEPVPDALWSEALARRWDVVPVVVQDPVWEGSFPAVGGLLVPIADPRSGGVRPVRMGAREARRLAAAHEQRRSDLLLGFARAGLEPVLVETSSAAAVTDAFARWAAGRQSRRGRW